MKNNDQVRGYVSAAVMAAVLAVLTGSACAAEFAGLQGLKASGIGGKVVTVSAAAAVPAAVEQSDLSAGRLKGLPGETAFDRLKNLFNEGVPATKEDLIGWHAGRMIKNSKPDQFVAALLVGREMLSFSEGGPLFEGDTSFKIILIDSPAVFPPSFPNYYEHLSGTDRTSLESQIRQGWYSKAEYTLKFPEAKLEVEFATVKGSIEERVARGYIVERFTASGVVASGTVNKEYYAYYFKDVTLK
ncbi:MAG: hypothetical protein WCK76_09575 [Elusimicrobiota bacterium]